MIGTGRRRRRACADDGGTHFLFVEIEIRLSFRAKVCRSKDRLFLESADSVGVKGGCYSEARWWFGS
jgi:hypothetical protein